MSRKQRNIEQAYGVSTDRSREAANTLSPAEDEATTVAEETVESGSAETGVQEPFVEDPVECPAASVETLEAELETLRARVAELEAKAEAEHQQFLRTMADFQNFRRRNEEQTVEIRRFATQELVLGLLPILDNFERALASGAEQRNLDKLLEGVSLTARQIGELLSKSGVEPIIAVGKIFDPVFHDAVMRVEGSDQPPNTVVEELQRGYTMHRRVLRPSIVKVAAEE